VGVVNWLPGRSMHAYILRDACGLFRHVVAGSGGSMLL
jgi:hypothetical protein